MLQSAAEPLVSGGGGGAPAAAGNPAILFAFVLIAAMANTLFGYENSVVATAVTDFMGCSSCDSAQQGLLKGALALGATLACPFAGFLQDGLGRRVTLVLCCAAYMGCAALNASAAAYAPGGGGGYLQLVVGRVLTGMVVGVFSSTVPMYVAELSPPAIRGSLVTVNQVCICTGILLGYMSSLFLSPSWRPQLLAATPLAAALLLAFVFVTPYSPRWLMTKGREDEARAVLLRIRGAAAAAAVEAELDAIREACDAVAAVKNKYALLLEPHIRWAVTIGVLGAIMQQWGARGGGAAGGARGDGPGVPRGGTGEGKRAATDPPPPPPLAVGVNAVNGFAPQIFESAGSTPAEAHMQTVYIGVAKLVFVLVALYLMDRVGRKPLLLVGCAGMAVTSALLAASYELRGAGANSLAVAALVLYMAFFEISLGPILWLLLSELYPLQVKGVAMSIGATATWLMTYVVNQTYLPMTKSSLGVPGSFYFFAAVSAASGLWIWAYLFETKGRTLEEIQALLKGEKVARPRDPEHELAHLATAE